MVPKLITMLTYNDETVKDALGIPIADDPKIR